MTDDLLSRAVPFLNQCGTCDLGLPAPCICPPPADYRPVMLELYREVERLRALLADSPYFCPTSGELEAPGYGGFDVCCDRPDLHRLTIEEKP